MRLPALAALTLLPALLPGCAAGILRTPEPLDPVLQRLHEEQLEIHREHHRQAMAAHETAVRQFQQMAEPPPPPAPLP